MLRNYYDILGVPTEASADDIRRQFREMARKYHPDVVRDKASGHNAFVQISEAYHILSAPARRADYDLKLRDQVRRLQSPSANGTRATPGPTAAGARPPGAPQP